jgi:drug/metabolite transporter (DMT)-like permease
MWIAYGVFGMLSIGAADFGAVLAGRRTTRQEEIFSVTWLLHVVGMVPVVVAALAFDPGSAQTSDFLWAAGAGVTLGLIRPLIYSGLSFGAIATFVPIVAVVSILLPFSVSVGRGEDPGVLQLIGIGLALPAMAIVGTRGADPTTAVWSKPQVLIAALACGALIGASSLIVGEMGEDAGLKPTLVIVLVGFIPITAATRMARVPVMPRIGVAIPTVVAGVLDGFGLAFVILAFQQGLVSVVAALIAMAPVIPVVLAWAILRERLRPIHAAAVVVAFIAVVLMVVG